MALRNNEFVVPSRGECVALIDSSRGDHVRATCEISSSSATWLLERDRPIRVLKLDMQSGKRHTAAVAATGVRDHSPSGNHGEKQSGKSSFACTYVDGR